MDVSMSAAEIILIVIGVVIFLLGYFMPARKKDTDEEVRLISEDEIRKMIAAEADHVKDRVADIVEETVSYSIEKTERAMERLTNEKIMAINEYSDTVLEEIHKNHKEVVFLYDMLNDKHDSLMAAVNEATQISEDVKQKLQDAEVTVLEATDKADDVLRAVDEASARINDVLRAADDAVKGVWDAQNAARVAREAAQEAIRIATDMTETKKTGIDMLADMQAQTSQEEETGEAQKAEIPETEEPVQEAEETDTPAVQEFKPITLKRVEIIHEPDEVSMETEPSLKREPGIKKEFGENSRGEGLPEGIPSVDIQFAKDNGRNSNERILDLHKAGKSNMAIAKELGLGLGEVKLVIDLFEGM